MSLRVAIASSTTRQAIAISAASIKDAIAKAIVLVLTLLLAACSITNNDQALTTPVAAPGAFKVAILLPGRINENSWSRAGYQGLKLIEKQLGAQVAYRSSVLPDEAETLFRHYANAGFDFIMGHGAQYLTSAEVVAKEFPRVKFAVTGSYAGNNKNLGTLSFRGGEMGYLTGMIAALKTNTNKVGYIGGQPYPATTEGAILFKRGVKQTKSSVTPLLDWVNSWSDTNKARAIALAQIAAGADVIFVDADEASFGVFQAVQESKKVRVIGLIHNLDRVHQTQRLAPEAFITLVVQQVPSLLLEGATLAQQGRWEGKLYKFGLLEEVQDLALFQDSLTPKEEAYVKSAKQDIITGKINIDTE
ncbi:MAG: BMP family protein [Cyanobacteriota bacterium]